MAKLSRWSTGVLAILTLSVNVRAVAGTDTGTETEAERRTRILTQTKLNVVTELNVPASEYKGDGDPTTLEIVMLTKKSDGPSRVSDDGEVIFLYKASDKTQQQLIQRAFEIRLARPE